jgi:IS605 OrfB family transposase
MILHNQAFQLCIDWLFENKLKTGSAKLVHDGTYRNIRNNIKGLPSQLAIKARMEAMSLVKTLKSQAKNERKDFSEITKPEKTRLAMRLDDRVFRMDPNGVSLTTRNGRIVCSLKWYPKAKQMFNSYAMCDPMVFERNGRIFLAMTFDDPKPTWVPNTCVGIDLGLNRLAVTSEGIIFQDKELLRLKRKIRYNRACLRNKMTTRKSKSAARKIKKVAKRERNITKNHIHLLCNGILKSTNATTLVMEDLSKIKSKNKGKHLNSRQAQVPYYLTKTILTYKAHSLGKRVETVNPAYTSKDDYRGLSGGVRKGCRYYANDGVVLDADHNAAINIAKRFVVQNELPISFTVPLRGRQTLWAGCSQSASVLSARNCGDAPLNVSSVISLAHKPLPLGMG